MISWVKGCASKCGLARNTVGCSYPWLSRARGSPKSPAPSGKSPGLRMSSGKDEQESITRLEHLLLPLVTKGQRTQPSLSFWNSRTGPCSVVRTGTWGRIPSEVCFSSYTLPGRKAVEEKTYSPHLRCLRGYRSSQKEPGKNYKPSNSLRSISKTSSDPPGLRNASSFSSITAI